MTERQRTFFSTALIILIFAMVALIKVITDNTYALESNFQAQKIIIEQNQHLLSTHEMMK